MKSVLARGFESRKQAAPGSARRMLGAMRASLPLLLCVGLVGCQQRGNDLTGQVLFTANGTFDPQADLRRREGKGMRSVEWRSKPPLPASAVRVVYDSDARPLAWQMTVERPTFTPTDLRGSGPRPVDTPRGHATLFTQGRLNGVLLVRSGSQEFTLLTRAYAEQHDPAALPAFRPAP